MTDREKLYELIVDAENEFYKNNHYAEDSKRIESVVDYLIANEVTVQKRGYLETVVEDKDNTVCGNGVKIEYKRCSCCKNPAKFFEDDFCGNCGAKLDLPQPPKGE